MLASLFNLSHLKERYSAMLKDKSVSIHATLAEMLGTGMVVLIGTAAVQLSDEATATQSALAQAQGLSGVTDPVQRHFTFVVNAIVFGLVYFMVTSATRHHNGAHLNPVITIASMLSGVCGVVQALVFIVVQVVGAIIASAILLGLTAEDSRDDALLGANMYDEVAAAASGNTKSRAFGVEIIGAFVLTYVYLQTFYHPRSEHRAIAPLAVGLAYAALLAATGPVSSASLNPARTLGPAAVARPSGLGDDLWIWTIGPLVGALIAVPLHLISVTDLPAFDKDGKMIKRSASAVDVAGADAKATAAVQSAV